MQYYNVCHLLRLIDAIEEKCSRFQARLWKQGATHGDSGEIKTEHPSWAADFIDEETLNAFRPTISLLKRKCEEAELEKALHRLNVRLYQKMRDGITFDQMITQIHELRHDIDSDLEYRRFVCIPTEKAKRLDGLAGRWEGVWPKIACEKDVRDSIECYAYGLNTAAVFHSMRVAEVGLRYLAESLDVTIRDKKEEVPIEFGDWEKVIQGVRGKIEEIKKLPSNETRAKHLQHYLDALDHCLYFRDRYRNPVSHTRSSYNDGEAIGAIDRVEEFMRLLAKGAT